jgi:hypothetical protein
LKLDFESKETELSNVQDRINREKLEFDQEVR